MAREKSTVESAQGMVGGTGRTGRIGFFFKTPILFVLTQPLFFLMLVEI